MSLQNKWTAWIESVRFNPEGLVPAIVQDAETEQVLMLAYMNREALKMTLETKLVHFWSRSRREIWLKGATSGNTLSMVSIQADCDWDALLIRVHPAGPVCHTGEKSCFFREMED